MTIEEQIERNKAISQYMLNIAVPLGLWFIVEYFLTVLSTQNLLLAALRTPIMMIMPIALCSILYKLRQKFFETEEFGRFRCWYYGIQVMFYAGLFEAFAVALYNQWIAPDNLTEMHNAMIAQYESVIGMYNQTPGAEQMFPNLMETFQQTLEVLKQTEVETPFYAAINLLSNDILYGCIWSLIFCFFLHRKPKVTSEQ